MAASVAPRGRALLWAGAAWLRQGGIGELLRAGVEGGIPRRHFSLSHYRSTVIVERWWKVPLAKEGQKPRLHRRHRVYKLVEDTKHRPKDLLELILTQSVDEIGVRGDLVSVKKSVGRNKLLAQGLAVYASPENKKLFEEEKLLRQEGKLEKIQTKEGESTVKFLRSCHLEVGMKNNVKWELNPEIVARHFFKNLGVVVAPHALKLPEEPITRWGEYWCDVTGKEKEKKKKQAPGVLSEAALPTNEPLDCGISKKKSFLLQKSKVGELESLVKNLKTHVALTEDLCSVPSNPVVAHSHLYNSSSRRLDTQI